MFCGMSCSEIINCNYMNHGYFYWWLINLVCATSYDWDVPSLGVCLCHSCTHGCATCACIHSFAPVTHVCATPAYMNVPPQHTWMCHHCTYGRSIPLYMDVPPLYRRRCHPGICATLTWMCHPCILPSFVLFCALQPCEVLST